MDKHLEKRQASARVDLPRLVAILRQKRSCIIRSSHFGRKPSVLFLCSDLAERGNETGDAHQPGVSEQLRDLGNAADVLLAVLGREAQVLVQAVTDVVSVQRVRWDGVGDEVLLQSEADGSLPGPGQT